MKKYGRLPKYVEKTYFLVSIETNLDVKNIKNYFGLPENAVLEWLQGYQGEILIGAHQIEHCNNKRVVNHFNLQKDHSTIEWQNYK
jgi:hypothetical protein